MIPIDIQVSGSKVKPISIYYVKGGHKCCTNISFCVMNTHRHGLK